MSSNRMPHSFYGIIEDSASGGHHLLFIAVLSALVGVGYIFFMMKDDKWTLE